MNGTEILRIVDAIHRDKNIEKEIVFEGIEQAIASAARKHFGEESEVVVDIARDSGEPSVTVDGDALNADEIGDLLGRIAAQTAKQVMIQKIREAERDALFEEYGALQGHMVSGTISQVTPGAATVSLGKVEGLLPRSEQIPGETHRVGERVRAIVLEVKKVGSRVKIVLSRTHPEMVRRLFELEIPEISEHVIEVRSLAREAGYRSKVAVSCYDSKIDCVGACVGVRGARIKNIVDELAGERIDIVRWNDSLQVLVPNALQPAEVEDVILCPMLGKVIVLVREDQLSLSIGKKGQNVRLASKLVGWDIHVLTQEKLDELLDSAVEAFSRISDVTEELAENLVAQGFFTFDDLSVIEPDQLADLGGLTAEQCENIIAYADKEAERIEQEEVRAAEEARELRKREAALARMEASMGIQPESDEALPPAEQQTPAETEPADASESETSETETSETESSQTETTEADEQPAQTAETTPAAEPSTEAATRDTPPPEETSPLGTAAESPSPDSDISPPETTTVETSQTHPTETTQADAQQTQLAQPVATPATPETGDSPAAENEPQQHEEEQRQTEPQPTTATALEKHEADAVNEPGKSDGQTAALPQTAETTDTTTEAATDTTQADTSPQPNGEPASAVPASQSLTPGKLADESRTSPDDEQQDADQPRPTEATTEP